MHITYIVRMRWKYILFFGIESHLCLKYVSPLNFGKEAM